MAADDEWKDLMDDGWLTVEGRIDRGRWWKEDDGLENRRVGQVRGSFGGTETAASGIVSERSEGSVCGIGKIQS